MLCREKREDVVFAQAKLQGDLGEEEEKGGTSAWHHQGVPRCQD